MKHKKLIAIGIIFTVLLTGCGKSDQNVIEGLQTTTPKLEEQPFNWNNYETVEIALPDPVVNKTEAFANICKNQNDQLVVFTTKSVKEKKLYHTFIQYYTLNDENKWDRHELNWEGLNQYYIEPNFLKPVKESKSILPRYDFDGAGNITAFGTKYAYIYAGINKKTNRKQYKQKTDDFVLRIDEKNHQTAEIDVPVSIYNKTSVSHIFKNGNIFVSYSTNDKTKPGNLKSELFSATNGSKIDTYSDNSNFGCDMGFGDDEFFYYSDSDSKVYIADALTGNIINGIPLLKYKKDNKHFQMTLYDRLESGFYVCNLDGIYKAKDYQVNEFEQLFPAQKYQTSSDTVRQFFVLNDETIVLSCMKILSETKDSGTFTYHLIMLKKSSSSGTESAK